jgi:hypothetical protein
MKALCWLLWLVAVAQGQDASAPEAALHASGAFFALSVADIQASAQWYSAKLGLRVVMDQPKREGAAVKVLEAGD